MRIFDLHQFHVLCASGIVNPKHSLPDILPIEHGKPCDIACIGTLLVIFQVIDLNIIAYTDCLCDLQGISLPFCVYRQNKPTSLRPVQTWVLTVSAPLVTAVRTAETATPPVTVENLAASGNGLTPLSHRSSPPRPIRLPHPRRGSRSSLSAPQR